MQVIPTYIQLPCTWLNQDPLHLMTNWSEFLGCVKLWTGRSKVCLDELLKEVRQALASSLKVPWQRVHVHDSADQRADSLRHCGNLAQELGCHPNELEQLFTRRVKARTQPPAGEHEEREPRHDSRKEIAEMVLSLSSRGHET